MATVRPLRLQIKPVIALLLKTAEQGMGSPLRDELAVRLDAQLQQVQAFLDANKPA